MCTAKCSKIFDWENKLTMDACALSAKQRENKSIQQYSLYNFYGDCHYNTVQEMAVCHPNLHFRNGYGFTSACTVDTDSAYRFPKTTHGPEKKILCTRTFTAVPDLKSGCLAPDIESYLKNGLDTNMFYCGRNAERDFDRFTPLLDCVQSYVNGYSKNNYFPTGIDSREETRKIMRNKCSQ